MNHLLKSLILLGLFFILSCQSKTESEAKVPNPDSNSAKITFVELGSVKCIPCKAMQPVMESIEKKYGDQINVVFYDVWKEDQKKYAQEYKIKLIPTQVFLNKEGKEIFRHEGFFPEKEIDDFLQKHGLKPGHTS